MNDVRLNGGGSWGEPMWTTTDGWGEGFGHKQDVHKHKIVRSEIFCVWKTTPSLFVHGRPDRIARCKTRSYRAPERITSSKRKISSVSETLYDPDVRKIWGGGGVFKTDEVGQGGVGVKKVSYWSDVLDG